MIYTVDTNIIAFLQRNHPRTVFPSIWEWLEQELKAGNLCICPKVIDELARTGGDQNKAMVNRFKSICSCTKVSPTPQEVTCVTRIGNQYPLWVRATKNEADPWVIAHAVIHHGGIMTNEGGNQGNPTNPKIPFVANSMYGITSLDFFGYAQSIGLTF